AGVIDQEIDRHVADLLRKGSHTFVPRDVARVNAKAPGKLLRQSRQLECLLRPPSSRYDRSLSLDELPNELKPNSSIRTGDHNAHYRQHPPCRGPGWDSEPVQMRSSRWVLGQTWDRG